MRVLTATIVAQVVIVVTGGVVRITGSGLGCPTWPACTDQSIAPTHGELVMWIEFTNRMIAAGVIALCVASLLAVVRRGDRTLTWWAIGQIAGVVAQAVIGGVAVIARLAPVVVALHMLVSAFLIYAAVTISLRYAGLRAGRPAPNLITVTCSVGLVVVVAGTMVSATGPYAGDASAARLAIDSALVTRLHALAAMALLVLLVTTARAVRRRTANRSSTLSALLTATLGLLVIQLGVGAWQVAAGRPAVGVAVHLLLAATLLAVLSGLHRLGSAHAQEEVRIP